MAYGMYGGMDMSMGFPISGNAMPWDPTTTGMYTPSFSTTTQSYPKASSKAYRKFPDQTFVDAVKSDGLYYPAKIISYNESDHVYTIQWKNKEEKDLLKKENEMRLTEGFGSMANLGYRLATDDEKAKNHKPGYILKGFATCEEPEPGTKSGRFVFQNGAWIAANHLTFGEHVPAKSNLAAAPAPPIYQPPSNFVSDYPYSIHGSLGYPNFGGWPVGQSTY